MVSLSAAVVVGGSEDADQSERPIDRRAGMVLNKARYFFMTDSGGGSTIKNHQSPKMNHHFQRKTTISPSSNNTARYLDTTRDLKYSCAPHPW